ncbi:hypothetical protein BK140_26615 [Paenibacillus macerans]|nr:hypothetical protein BK140_26615 [Paenibacillus macerans]
MHPRPIIDNYGNLLKLIGTEKGVGMERALKMLDLPLDGTHHRGIDDAKNISKIFRQNIRA